MRRAASWPTPKPRAMPLSAKLPPSIATSPRRTLDGRQRWLLCGGTRCKGSSRRLRLQMHNNKYQFRLVDVAAFDPMTLLAVGSTVAGGAPFLGLPPGGGGGGEGAGHTPTAREIL